MNLTGYADVGGFGAASDFTYQLSVGLNDAFSKAITGKFGYRYLSVDYDKGSFLYDMKLDGLYIGVGIRFGRRRRPLPARAALICTAPLI